MDIIHILSTYKGRNGKLEQKPALIIIFYCLYSYC